MKSIRYSTYFFLIFYSFFMQGQESEIVPLIRKISVTKNQIVVKAHPLFQYTYLSSNFFIEYPEEEDLDLTKLDFTIVSAPFIMNVIPMVWVSNKRYSIKAMDEDLYYALERIRETFKIFFPMFDWTGQLEPKRLVKNTLCKHTNKNEPKVGLLFSGGLDAVHASFKYRSHKQLLITVWGSDVKFDEAELWPYVKNRCAEYAKIYNHDHTWGHANIRRFLNVNYLNHLTPEIPRWCGYTLQGLGYLGVAIPILVFRGISHVMIASGRTSDSPHPYGTHPLIENNIRCAGIQSHHVCTIEERIEKFDEISRICKKKQVQKPFLRVCWGNDKQGGNCCRCSKCLLTINEILITGKNPNEYGFPVSFKSIGILTRYLMRYGGEVINHGAHWEYAREVLRNNLVLGKKSNNLIYHSMANYFSWFLEVPKKRFDVLKNQPHVIPMKNKLKKLWEESCLISDRELDEFLS